MQKQRKVLYARVSYGQAQDALFSVFLALELQTTGFQVFLIRASTTK
jgi:hypothetical protein